MTFRRPAALTVALGVVALAIAVAAGLAIGSPETSTAVERTATVKKGVVQSTVSGTGNLEPAQQVDVDFSTSGEITYVAVKAGDHVDEGDVLAKIDDAKAKVAVAQAEAELDAAQETLSTASDTSAAYTASTAATIPVAYTATTTTAPTTTAPQTTPSETIREAEPAETETPTQTQTTPQMTSPSTQGSGGSTTSYAAASAAVESAKLALADAEEDLEATVLRAPISGTVADVTKAVGETSGSTSSSSSPSSGGGAETGGADTSSSSSSSSSFITISQLSRLRMDVSLSESDIDDVKKGQAATVTVNAVDGKQVAAKVTSISVLSSDSSSSDAVSYPVTLTLDKTGTKLRAGMSASAEIVTAETSGLVVPSQALQGSTVTVEANGTRETRQVQTGVAGDTTTEIVSGLEEGDVVVVQSAAAAAGAAAGQAGGGSQQQSQQGARGAFGGLGGGGGAVPQGGPPGGGMMMRPGG